MYHTEIEIEGRTVKAGDRVWFKSDIEQTGEVKQIVQMASGVVLVLVNGDGPDGTFLGEYDYGRKETNVRAEEAHIN